MLFLLVVVKKARDIKASGRDAKGIYFAVDYLTEITKSLLNSQLEDQTFVEQKVKMYLLLVVGILVMIVLVQLFV